MTNQNRNSTRWYFYEWNAAFFDYFQFSQTNFCVFRIRYVLSCMRFVFTRFLWRHKLYSVQLIHRLQKKIPPNSVTYPFDFRHIWKKKNRMELHDNRRMRRTDERSRIHTSNTFWSTDRIINGHFSKTIRSLAVTNTQSVSLTINPVKTNFKHCADNAQFSRALRFLSSVDRRSKAIRSIDH